MPNDNNIKVFDRFHLPDSKFIFNGQHTRPTYELNGDNELVEKGDVDFVEQIQSYRGLYDVKDIVRRYNMGDNTALGVPSNNFVDNTGASTDLRSYTPVEVQRKIQDAYSSLADDIRSGFADVNDFAQSLREGKFLDRLNEITKSKSNTQSSTDGGNQE